MALTLEQKAEKEKQRAMKNYGYKVNHTYTYTFTLNFKTDVDILAKLASVENKAGYLKDLIRADLKANPMPEYDLDEE